MLLGWEVAILFCLRGLATKTHLITESGNSNCKTSPLKTCLFHKADNSSHPQGQWETWHEARGLAANATCVGQRASSLGQQASQKAVGMHSMGERLHRYIQATHKCIVICLYYHTIHYPKKQDTDLFFPPVSARIERFFSEWQHLWFRRRLQCCNDVTA